MEINFLEYVNMLIVLACLLVGWCIKQATPIDNKYIPVIVISLGAIIMLVTSGFSLENFVIGGISGAGSTGLHQAFTKFIEKSE